MVAILMFESVSLWPLAESVDFSALTYKCCHLLALLYFLFLLGTLGEADKASKMPPCGL